MTKEIVWQNSVYVGKLNRQNVPHGRGVLHLGDGRILRANWDHGLLNGMGSLWNPKTKWRTLMNWTHDTVSNFVTIFFPDGTTYRGEVINGKRHGIGRQTYRNGSVRFGNWVNNVFAD